MKVLGLITARGGSKGIPGKNIKLLKGKPLIAYTIEGAIKSQKISRLILSSDDQYIIELVKKFDIEIPFQRPVGLAKDDTPTIEVMKHALNFF